MGLGAEPPALYEALQRAREAAGLTQEQVAAKIGRHPITVSRWEQPNGRKPSEEDLEKLARLYGTTRPLLRYGGGVIREVPAEPFTPNPALRKRLRPEPYKRVYEHIERMVAAGCSIEQIEEAERLMIDGAYNKLNARDPRERSDEEMILDIDDAWDWIKEVLSRAGVKGL